MTELEGSDIFPANFFDSEEQPTDIEAVEQVEDSAPDAQEGTLQDNPETAHRMVGESQVDWEKRFKGLQRKYSQDQRRYQEIERRNLELEDALIDQVVQQVPEEQREYQAQLMRMAAQVRHQQEQNIAYAMHNEELDRLRVIDHLAASYGIEPGELERFDDPDQMHWFAQREAQKNQTIQQLLQRQQRVSSGADRFEGQGNPTPRKPVTDEDEAAVEFMTELRRRGFYR